MLQNLHVKNLALIDECEVDFSTGLNILTGETGAGKSIIIGSINLALGQKAPKEMLREGETAYVELLFTVENPQTIEALRALDIEIDEDHTLILSRKMTASRAIGRINGEAVSVAAMKEAASLLIDIHGQHEHQSLLNKKKHLAILDEYAGTDMEQKKAVLAKVYREYRELKEEFESANLDAAARARELSFLEYETQEIRNASLTVGEDEELEALVLRLSNGRRIMEGTAAAYSATSEDRSNASDLISHALRELSAIASYDEELASLEQQLGDIDNLLSDFNRELSAYISGADFDEQTLYESEKRLDEINHLKSKYGKTIPAILKACEEKEERMEVLNDYDAYLDKLSRRLEKSQAQAMKLCGEISALRRKTAEELVPAITAALKDLNFLDVRFSMEFSRLENFNANGYDEAEFMISTNPGQPIRPLGKVASGGELSRIMLAIKAVMASNDHIETLIFDEIDTGISGRTAQRVAEKMNELGRSHQIICITHLPQIASMADAHYLISKSTDQISTHTDIRCLNEQESIGELARMLGGVSITDTVMESAREMKALAREKK